MNLLRLASVIVLIFSIAVQAEQLHPAAKQNDTTEDIKGSIVDPTPEQKAQLEEEIKKVKSDTTTVSTAPDKTKKKPNKKKKKKEKANK